MEVKYVENIRNEFRAPWRVPSQIEALTLVSKIEIMSPRMVEPSLQFLKTETHEAILR